MRWSVAGVVAVSLACAGVGDIDAWSDVDPVEEEEADPVDEAEPDADPDAGRGGSRGVKNKVRSALQASEIALSDLHESCGFPHESGVGEFLSEWVSSLNDDAEDVSLTCTPAGDGQLCQATFRGDPDAEWMVQLEFETDAELIIQSDTVRCALAG